MFVALLSKLVPATVTELSVGIWEESAKTTSTDKRCNTVFAWRSDLWRTGLRTAPHPGIHLESWLPQRKQQIIHRKSSSIVGATTYELDYSTTAVPYPHCRAKHEAAQASSSLSKLTNLSQRALAMNYLRAEVGRAVSCVAVSCSCGSFLATPTLADLFHPLYLYLYLSKLGSKKYGISELRYCG